jgi:hypothetical protein
VVLAVLFAAQCIASSFLLMFRHPLTACTLHRQRINAPAHQRASALTISLVWL